MTTLHQMGYRVGDKFRFIEETCSRTIRYVEQLGFEPLLPIVQVNAKEPIFKSTRKKIMKKPINKITRDNIAEFTTKRDQNPTFNTIDLYQRTATKSAFYPGQGSPLGLTYVALKMNGEAGEFAEHVGKAMRDDNLMEPGEYTLDGMNFPIVHASEALTEERRALIIKEMGDVLWYLSAACNELNMRLSEVALINLEKLCDRGERDAMQGSGDDR